MRPEWIQRMKARRTLAILNAYETKRLEYELRELKRRGVELDIKIARFAQKPVVPTRKWWEFWR